MANSTKLLYNLVDHEHILTNLNNNSVNWIYGVNSYSNSDRKKVRYENKN
jgi:hypothetical protein